MLLPLAAESLFKLMAIKDEYEVARLYSQVGFINQLKDEFEGNFKVKYHFAPPILTLGRDARGRPTKYKFGSWMGLVLGALAHLRGLRGTILDPFRYTEDRKMDLQTLAWFETLLKKLDPANGADLVDIYAKILSAPMDISRIWYGPVRKEAIDKIRKHVDDLIDQTSYGTMSD